MAPKTREWRVPETNRCGVNVDPFGYCVIVLRRTRLGEIFWYRVVTLLACEIRGSRRYRDGTSATGTGQWHVLRSSGAEACRVVSKIAGLEGTPKAVPRS